VTKLCLWVDIQDLITCATFGDDRLRSLGVARGRISHFPIDLRRRPYNTRTTVRVRELRVCVFFLLVNFFFFFCRTDQPDTIQVHVDTSRAYSPI